MIGTDLGAGKFVLSFDDYHPGNIKIAQELCKRQLVATFFIETMTPGALQQIEELHMLGMEIGSHTMTHPGDMKVLSSEEMRGELMTSKVQIERITGKPCTALAYPRGRFNDDVIEVARAVGYEEARTTHVLKTMAPDPFRTPTTIHVYDGRKEYEGRPWRVMADFYLEHVLKNGGFFHIWGHAREIERDGQLHPMLDFLAHAIRRRP